jgi:hypothetical protein
MADVFVEFDTVIRGADGIGWIPRACGRVDDRGLWEGWIEFVPDSAAARPVRTRRETEQPNRDDLMYWAQGLTQVYLEDALTRALTSIRAHSWNVADSAPAFDGPAPRTTPWPAGATSRAVLNPFAVYQQGEDVLLRALSALHPPRLREIVVDFGFASAGWAEGKSRAELTTAIMAGVRNPTIRRVDEGRATP